MKFYKTEEIRKVASCSDIAERMFGAKIQDGRCAAVWRGGDNPQAVAIDKEKFYDHKTKSGGGCFELVMSGKNCSFHEAVSILGEFCNLEPATFADAGIKEKSHVVKEYIYVCENGEPKHKTIRFEPKSFSQMRFSDNEWKAGLNGSITYIYNLPEVLKADTVFLSEGEKDADTVINLGLCGTTIPQGAGNWKEHYAEWFRKKQVIILCDNDLAGQEHGDICAYALKDTAKQIKVLTISQMEKGDVTDWLGEEGGTKELLLEAVRSAKPVNLSTLMPPADKALKDAKELNKTAFQNYFEMEVTGRKGGTDKIKVAKNIVEMVKELHRRLIGFPRRVGSKLFDMDKDNKRVRIIETPADLQAWISEKTKHNCDFGCKGGQSVSIEQFFSALYNNGMSYQMISGVPHYPTRNDVYYTHGELPEATPDAHYFETFCKFFCPASYSDALLVKLAIVSPIYYNPSADRPIFIIDSVDGQGVGKSKFVDMICNLYGDPLSPESFSPIDISPDTLTKEHSSDRIARRILSTAARQKRIMRIDNITGYFKSDFVSTICTSSYITGMSPYAKGEESRANDLTIYITSNQAHLSADFISRGFIVHLKTPPGTLREWEHKIIEYVSRHRLNIISDIIGLIKRREVEADIPYNKTCRFKLWEDTVLLPVVKKISDYELIWTDIVKRRKDSDGELLEAEIIKEAIEEKIRAVLEQFFEEADLRKPIWINWDAFSAICQGAIPGIGGKDGRGLKHIIKNAIVTKRLPELSTPVDRFPPTRGAIRKRGILFDPEKCYENAKKNKTQIDVKILKMTGEKFNPKFSLDDKQ